MGEEYYDFQIKINKTGTKLKVINLENNDENVFESIRLASRTLNISRNDINKFIKNKEKKFIINNYKFNILN